MREDEGFPALLEQQDVEMPGETASVKRGADGFADIEERARLRLGAEGKRGQKHGIQDILKPQAKRKARLEDVENTTLTVPVVCDSAPIQGGSSSSTDVPVVSSVTASMSVEDMVQTNVPVFWMLESNLPILVQLDRCASMKARPETSKDLVLT